ncbi:hypothetical protein [Candidatus Bodocaedibacter vickermanii]|uniref:Lipoprotein n=1 Tax=Candidatus Bodocaedibacter vickermanii TaxID=2741701 RepID=A0A7L9RV36_9PROT|nr:hypothetical protein CPBP_01194 [Candidatus Paracaedibacteraceae bacterium 'Lake Konstanz']
MRNKFTTPLLLSTALIITACGGGSNNNSDSIQGIDSKGNPFKIDGDLPDINIRTWQAEFKKHQDQAGALPAQGDGYVVTDENELLIYKYNFKQNISGVNPFKMDRLKGILVLGGKVFVDGKRIYDIQFIQKLMNGVLTQKEMDSAAQTYGVVPKNEDKVLLDEYSKTGENPSVDIQHLAKKDNSTPEKYIPKLSTQSWEDAFKEHQNRVAKIKSDPLGNYRITTRDELLVYTPKGLMKALSKNASSQEG